MIITQTPFRMSFFGGGTDYPSYYEEYGGSVLSTTINKYCYLNVRYFPPFFEHRNQATYSVIERFNDPSEVKHPAIRECLKFMDMHSIHIMYDADLPARSGLGSSSSFTVGLLNALHSLRGEFTDKLTLAKEAIYVEHQLCGEIGGVQDQLAASFGGLNRIYFSSSGFDIRPVIISKERRYEFNKQLMLFFTGFVRFSSEIAEEQAKSTKSKLAELHEMSQLVNEGENILTGNNDINKFGQLLDHTWRIKRSLTNRISTNFIDDVYEKALKAGATGGKLLGAGGGGFMLLFVEPDKQVYVKKALADLLHVPFEFENSGTKVIYYRPSNYKPSDERVG